MSSRFISQAFGAEQERDDIGLQVRGVDLGVDTGIDHRDFAIDSYFEPCAVPEPRVVRIGETTLQRIVTFLERGDLPFTFDENVLPNGH